MLHRGAHVRHGHLLVDRDGAAHALEQIYWFFAMLACHRSLLFGLVDCAGVTVAGDRRRRTETSINSLPHGSSWKFLTQGLEGVTIPLSSVVLGRYALGSALSARFCRPAGRGVLFQIGRPADGLGFPEAWVPLIGWLA
jgi:hypothetical protein